MNLVYSVSSTEWKPPDGQPWSISTNLNHPQSHKSPWWPQSLPWTQSNLWKPQIPITWKAKNSLQNNNWLLKAMRIPQRKNPKKSKTIHRRMKKWTRKGCRRKWGSSRTWWAKWCLLKHSQQEWRMVKGNRRQNSFSARCSKAWWTFNENKDSVFNEKALIDMFIFCDIEAICNL